MGTLHTERCTQNNLAFDFYRHACEQGDRTALYVDECAWSYTEVAERVAPLAGWLSSRFPQGGQNIGILANRSAEAYIGLLAALWSGNAYVPLNSKLPAAYLHTIMERAQVECLVVDPLTAPIMKDPHLDDQGSLTLLSPLNSLPDFSGCTLVDPHEIATLPPLTEPVAISAEQTAYIIFTSGSTGTPKGIAPTVANVTCFLDATQERYKLKMEDRLSQANDLHWDPSVFDMFSAWKVGASTHVVPDLQLFAPAHFIRSQKLSIWYSGPVQIKLMRGLRQLKTGSLPSLRLSLFVGEPLLRDAAEAWQAAACNSLVENVYGPTETTVVCLGQPFSDDPACITPERDYVAIGTPYRNVEVTILDEQRKPLPVGQIGEIVIGGPVVAPGYWRYTEQTARSFVRLSGSQKRYYLTGDLGYQSTDGIFHFIGRKDNQLQVLGMRIEPEEIEKQLRRITGVDEVAVIGWPVEHGLVMGLVAFTEPSDLSVDEIKLQLRESLPAAMIPKVIQVLEHLPRNQNHKVDRTALLLLLEEKKGFS
jgi:D-alanine--poly(phosphoribitol) ligase subunit 1